MEKTNRLNHLLKEKDHIFYGQVKDGQAPCPSLVIRLKDGNQHAYGYHYLAKDMKYNPSTGIRMTFLDPDSSVTVHIEGRNLLVLWDALVWHKVTFIRELDTPLDQYDESTLCITNVTIKTVM